MKRSVLLIFMAAAISLLSVAAVTAEGIQEQRDGNAAPQRGDRNFTDEVISVSGTIEFSVSGAELKTSDGQEYELMYPRFLAGDIEIESGDTITVEGYLMPGPRWDDEGDEQYLRISSVTIDGEEYDLETRVGHGPRGNSGKSGKPGTADRNGRDRGPGMQDDRPYRW